MDIGLAVANYHAEQGTGGYVAELLARLSRAHRVTLYASGLHAPVPDGVEVVRVPALRGSAYATILSFPAAFAAVRRSHDVVHTQGWLTGHADVTTAHIVLAAWRAAARSVGGVAGIGERLFGGFVERREAALYRSGTAVVIAPSERVRRELAEWYGRVGEIVVIPHGFPDRRTGEPRAEARTALRLPHDRFVATYVGDARKGLDVAIEALAHAPAAHLAIVTHAGRRAFTARAASLGVASRMHWLGPQSNMARVYDASDVLLHPTIYDAFGLIVSEAMASGVPAVVTRAAGVTELIDHDVNGWILAERTATAAGAAQAHQGGDRGRLARLGRAATETARNWSWDAVTEHTVGAYQRAVAMRP